MTKTSIILLNAFPDKKIKSFGNKCLLKITNKLSVIDYHLQILKKLFKDPQIIVVGGFDGKRLNKYITQNFKDKHNICYVEHEITSDNNIGTSVLTGLKLAIGQNIFLLSSAILLKNKASQLIDKTNSFVGTQNTTDASVGYVKDGRHILNCYYELPNEILDMFYISKDDTDILYDIIKNIDINKYYLFEIINLCIQAGMRIKPATMTKGSIYCVDSCNKIKNLNKLNPKYV